MKALITGATGFIGSHLTERLISDGLDVTCIVRDSSDLRWLENSNAHIVRGSLSDQSFINKVVQGQDYIFHLAGLTKSCYKEEYFDVNYRLTSNVIESVAESNPEVKRFVLLSSLSAFGPEGSGTIREDSRMPHPVSNYGKSKLMAEDSVRAFMTKLPITIIRPCAVYGPRDREFLLIFKMIMNRFVPLWGNSRISLIYISDLVDGIVASARTECATGKTYFLSDGNIYTTGEIIYEIASALNIKIIKLPLPQMILPIIGFFSEIICKIRNTNSMINRDKIREIMYPDWTCEITEARNDFAFSPIVELQQGIRWTVEWYRNQKWI